MKPRIKTPQVSLRKLVPSALTVAAICLGLSAVKYALDHRPTEAMALLGLIYLSQHWTPWLVWVVLTLVVTPAMLMVFTRAKRRTKKRGWLGRIWDRVFRRGRQPETVPGTVVEGSPGEPQIAYPKAAE